MENRIAKIGSFPPVFGRSGRDVFILQRAPGGRAPGISAVFLQSAGFCAGKPVFEVRSVSPVCVDEQVEDALAFGVASGFAGDDDVPVVELADLAGQAIADVAEQDLPFAVAFGRG